MDEHNRRTHTHGHEEQAAKPPHYYTTGGRRCRKRIQQPSTLFVMLFIKSVGQLASTLLKHGAPRQFLAAPLRYNLLSVAARRYLATEECEKLIIINDSCLNRLRQILDRPEQELLRINVETGGCSGFSYVFSVEHEKQVQPEEDLIFERDNYRVVVNKDILPYIKGSTIDYHESLIKRSFQVINPIAETKCSCGSSFSIDLNKLRKSTPQSQEQK